MAKKKRKFLVRDPDWIAVMGHTTFEEYLMCTYLSWDLTPP